ncbi:MAG: PKD domain-containing protein [Bacteroidota bacterium]
MKRFSSTTKISTMAHQSSLLIFFLFLLITNVLSQQGDNQMRSKEYNFSLLTTPRQGNLEEWKKYNDPADYDHPEFGYLPEEAPCQNCVEVLSKRDFDKRYFINIDNPSEFYSQTAMGELHVKVGEDWIRVDHTLNKVADNIYESTNTLETAGFNVFENRSYIQTTIGNIYFNNWSLFTKTGDVLTSKGTANWSNYIVGEDGILIHNVFPGIDAEMVVFRGAIKTSFIIRENLMGTFEELIFRDQFDTPLSPTVEFTGGIMSEGVGELTVFSGSTDVLHMNEAALYAKGGPKELMESGVYRINGNSVDIVVRYDWINDNIDEYQMVVDPVVTGTNTLAQASILGSQYNASCNFTNSCNATLSVNRPANATVTDVQWSFNYLAQGSCWREDGATRFSVGACVSPNIAGFYWFCNLPSAGTCTGTNITIFSDVAGCLPAPSCVAVPVNFTMQFFRACWGTTGCNNTCIGAASPWTMTIIGNTIQYNNVATPFSLSATTVCAGGSITASTTGAFGVPGYTYNWSFSPSGIPSVGSGASASIVFPTSGSITLYSIVTDACGNQVTYSRVVTVTPGPTINVNSPTICAGASATLTATGGTTYTWSPPGGLSATTGTSVTANPAVTTVYTVVGTTSGCSGTATSTVTVTPNPVINVNSATICAGGSATLTAGGGTTYTWSPPGGLSATTGTSVTANPVVTTVYTVTGTTSGCSGTATSTVTIGPNPVVNVNSPTICAGASATLTANGATTYTWSPPGGLSATTGTSVTANPAVTTVYTVTGLIGGCTGTATSTVTVEPNPVVNVNSPTICAGSSATLTANGATSYTWSPAGGLSATTGASVTANPAVTTVYTVTGTTGSCTGTATATVTVDPIPVVVVNGATICDGASTTLTANGATTYVWSPATGLSATSGSSVTANPVVTTTYTIDGTTNGCTGTTTATVTVNPNPVVNVNSPTICAGASATLTANGATSYTWSPPGGLSATTGASVTANPAATTVYTVTGTTLGCTATATSTVTVTPNPVVNVNSPTICAGSSTTLTANGATTYTWSPPGGLSATTGASVTANPAATTVYTVTGTSSGCTGTATSTVTVNPIPAAVAGNNGPLCPGDQLNLTAANVPGATYSWSGPNAFSSALQNPTTASIVAADAGVYTVTVTLNGCTSTATTTLALNPGSSTVINPSGPYCSNGNQVTLTAASPGGTWTGNGIVNPATGLFDPSAAQIGNNTVTYDVPNGCGGPSSATIVVLAIPTVNFSPDVTSGCAPLPVTYTNLSNPQGASVTWNFGNGGSSNTIASANTTYTSDGCFDVTLTVTDNQGCTNSATLNDIVCVIPAPIAAFTTGEPIATITDPSFQFINGSANAVSYVWEFGDGTSSTTMSPNHTYPGEGGYEVILIATNAAGCVDTAELTVKVIEELIYYIPNTFTPDGNEFNNTFQPVFTSGFDPYTFNMKIFNRWGETIFETKNHEIGWDGTYDGKLVPQGTYTWKVYFRDAETDKKYEDFGHILLIR